MSLASQKISLRTHSSSRPSSHPPCRLLPTIDRSSETANEPLSQTIHGMREQLQVLRTLLLSQLNETPH